MPVFHNVDYKEIAHPTGPGRTLFQQTSVESSGGSIVFPFLWDFRWVIRFWSGVVSSSMCFYHLLAKELFGEGSPMVWVSLTTCFHFIYEHCARTGEMDAILLFFLVSSLYFLIRSEKNPRLLPISFIHYGVAGSLTKEFPKLFAIWDPGFYTKLITGEMEELSSLRVIQAFLLFWLFLLAGLLQ